MKNLKIKYLILYIVAIIPVILTVIFYSRLPESYPIHWNIYGEIDRYGSRSSSLITAFIPMFIIIMMQAVPKVDPKKRNYEYFKGSYYNFQLMFVVLMGLLHLLTMFTSIGYEVIKVDSGVKLIIAVLFTVIGNMMPKFKHNYFIGIRTPWTLANEDVWFATHRIGGKLWFYGGLLMIILSFVSGELSAIAYFSIIFISVIYAFIFSYLKYRKLSMK